MRYRRIQSSQRGLQSRRRTQEGQASSSQCDRSSSWQQLNPTTKYFREGMDRQSNQIHFAIHTSGISWLSLRYQVSVSSIDDIGIGSTYIRYGYIFICIHIHGVSVWVSSWRLMGYGIGMALIIGLTATTDLLLLLRSKLLELVLRISTTATRTLMAKWILLRLGNTLPVQ